MFGNPFPCSRLLVYWERWAGSELQGHVYGWQRTRFRTWGNGRAGPVAAAFVDEKYVAALSIAAVKTRGKPEAGYEPPCPQRRARCAPRGTAEWGGPGGC